MVEETPPIVGGIAKSEVAPGLSGKPSTIQLAACFRPFRVLETSNKKLLGLFEQSPQLLSCLMPLFRLRTSRRQLHSIAPRQSFYRFREVEVFHLHDELEDVATLVATKAVVEALLGID